MTFLISISFIYIFDFYFIIKAENVNVYNINVDCGDSSFYYNSLIYNCTKCESSVINENICYSEVGKRKSIYFGTNHNFTNEAIISACTSKKFTELDDEGRFYGDLMCLETTISVTEDDKKFYDEAESEIKNGKNEFELLYLSQPNRTKLESPQRFTITPDFYNDDEIPYYYHSCIKGYYKKSCQFLANLCTLAIYVENNRFCKIIEKLSANIYSQTKDSQ